jgi:hypothetical protein
MWRMLFRFSKNNFLLSQNMRISSTKSRCVRKQFGEIWMPLKSPCETTFVMSRLKLSTTRRKRRGESGHPCMSPLSTLKNGDVDPFMRMEK